MSDFAPGGYVPGDAVWFMPRPDTVTNTVEDAARFERERAEAAGEYDDRPTIRAAKAESLREAAADADPWDDLHPAASWLMSRAEDIERGES